MDCSTPLDYSYPPICGRRDGTLCTIQPDPDIAGIGVIVAFIVNGLLVLLPTLWKAWCELERGQHLYRPIGWSDQFPLPRDSERPEQSKPDWPDLKDAELYLSHERKKRQGARPGVLATWIFALADTQFIAGIAIAAAMSKNEIVLSHFAVSYELTWLGFISATAGLFMTRSEILDSGNNARRVVRLLVMWTHFGLIIHRAREFDEDLWYAERVHGRGPIPPYLRWAWDSVDDRVGIFIFVWSIFGVVVDTIFIRPKYAILACHYAAKGARAMLDGARDQYNYGRRPQAVLRCAMYSLGYLLSMSLWMLFFEPLSYSLVNIFSFLWGVAYVFSNRAISRSCMHPDDRSAEDEIGFGQTVALVLLMGPFISSIDLWWEDYGDWTLWKGWFAALKDRLTNGRRDEGTAEQDLLREESDANSESGSLIGMASGVSRPESVTTSAVKRQWTV